MGDLEIWESQIKGREGVVRAQPGGGTTVELIRGGAQFSITPEERRLTDQAASNPKRKPFQNGIFRPVELIDSAEDFHRLQSLSEQSLADSDIEGIIEGNFKTVEKRIRGIDSPYTLRRILEKAEAAGAAAARIRLLKARLDEVDPQVEPSPERDANNELDEGPGGAPARQRQSYYPDADQRRGRTAAVGG